MGLFSAGVGVGGYDGWQPPFLRSTRNGAVPQHPGNSSSGACLEPKTQFNCLGELRPLSNTIHKIQPFQRASMKLDMPYGGGAK